MLSLSSQQPRGKKHANVRANLPDNKVVFCTGGNGDLGRVQVRAMVYLGANACIVGRNVDKTRALAEQLATVREGAHVLGYGGIDVRDFEGLRAAVDSCASELGGIDFVMLVFPASLMPSWIDVGVHRSGGCADMLLIHLVQELQERSSPASRTCLLARSSR